jgi:hypothetical protein
MKFEHRGKKIELFWLASITQIIKKKVWKEARAVWKTVINGEEYCGTDTGDREEALENGKNLLTGVYMTPI